MSEHIEHHHHSVLDAFNPLHNKLNWLLLAVPLTLYFEFQHNVEMTFLFSMIAIMPLAFLMGHATEEIALRAVKISVVYSTLRSETPLKSSLQVLPFGRLLIKPIKPMS